MGAPRRSSLISRVVTLVAFALFAIEIAVLVPFTWLYWQRLLDLRRETLERQADGARPHVREALLREREHSRFESDQPPVFDGGPETFIFTASGVYRLTANHELAPARNPPPRTPHVTSFFEPGARSTVYESGGYLVYVSPVHLEEGSALGRADAVLYIPGSLVEMKKQFAAYGILSFLIGAATLLVMGTITIYHLRARFLIPLARLISADNAARHGDANRALIRNEHVPDDELGAIMRSRNALIVRMWTAQSALDEKNAELERQRAELAAWGRELERLVHEKTNELVAARESLFLTEKLAALGRLAANVAHEINNPLASIAGYAEEVRERLAEVEGTPPDLPDGLRVIEEQAFRCKEILKRLLGLARQDNFKLEPLDLSALARDTVRLIEPQARKKGVVLEVQAREPVVARSDASSLQQVILNLVENAVDAATAAREQRGSGGRVVVSATTRSAGGAAGDRELVLRVADDGLAISQSIVERLGGRIEVEGVEGQGATFVVVLPLLPPEPDGVDGTPARGIWAVSGAAVGPGAGPGPEVAGNGDPSVLDALAAAARDADPDSRSAGADDGL